MVRKCTSHCGELIPRLLHDAARCIIIFSCEVWYARANPWRLQPGPCALVACVCVRVLRHAGTPHSIIAVAPPSDALLSLRPGLVLFERQPSFMLSTLRSSGFWLLLPHTMLVDSSDLRRWCPCLCDLCSCCIARCCSGPVSSDIA